jgi:hypothetical protein
MVKWGRISLVLVIVIITTLLIFNYRYPFISPGSKGWSIGYMTIDNPLQKIIPSKNNIISYDSLKMASASPTRFMADPFLFHEKGTYYLFFEHQLKIGPARIGLLQSSDGMNYSFKGNIINETFHLSFPQIFKYKNNYYILPESAAAGQVILYKAVNFPLEWKISDTLIKNIKLKDPAILISDSLNLLTGLDDKWNQQVFKADSLLGKWKKDASFNTKKGDEIRPAGNFFSIGESWYLPFQNNLEGYGTGVSLYRLKGNGFVRTIPQQLYRNDSIKKFSRGMHHLSVNFLNGKYLLVYDGDEANFDNEIWTWKSSVKYNFYDIYNFMFQ